MRGCGCLLTLLTVALPLVIVLLALQPPGELPPSFAPDAAARFDSKAAALAAASSGAAVAFAEEEINAKLASMLAPATAPGVLRAVFVRFRPENRMAAVVLLDIFGRTVGGSATLRFGPPPDHPETGTAFAWEDARIGALPLPVGLVTDMALPWLGQYGVALPGSDLLPASGYAFRVDGANLTVIRR